MGAFFSNESLRFIIFGSLEFVLLILVVIFVCFLQFLHRNHVLADRFPLYRVLNSKTLPQKLWRALEPEIRAHRTALAPTPERPRHSSLPLDDPNRNWYTSEFNLKQFVRFSHNIVEMVAHSAFREGRSAHQSVRDFVDLLREHVRDVAEEEGDGGEDPIQAPLTDEVWDVFLEGYEKARFCRGAVIGCSEIREFWMALEKILVWFRKRATVRRARSMSNVSSASGASNSIRGALSSVRSAAGSGCGSGSSMLVKIPSRARIAGRGGRGQGGGLGRGIGIGVGRSPFKSSLKTRALRRVNIRGGNASSNDFEMSIDSLWKDRLNSDSAATPPDTPMSFGSLRRRRDVQTREARRLGVGIGVSPNRYPSVSSRDFDRQRSQSNPRMKRPLNSADIRFQELLRHQSELDAASALAQGKVRSFVPKRRFAATSGKEENPEPRRRRAPILKMPSSSPNLKMPVSVPVPKAVRINLQCSDSDESSPFSSFGRIVDSEGEDLSDIELSPTETEMEKLPPRAPVPAPPHKVPSVPSLHFSPTPPDSEDEDEDIVFIREEESSSGIFVPESPSPVKESPDTDADAEEEESGEEVFVYVDENGVEIAADDLDDYAEEVDIEYEDVYVDVDENGDIIDPDSSTEIVYVDEDGVETSG